MLTYHSTKQVLSVVLHIWIPVAFSTYRLSSMCGHSVYTTGSESIPLLLFLLPPVYRGKRSPCLLFLFLFLLPLKTLAPTPRLLPAIWECVDMWGWTVEHQSINNTFYYTYMSLTPVKTMKRFFFFIQLNGQQGQNYTQGDRCASCTLHMRNRNRSMQKLVKLSYGRHHLVSQCSGPMQCYLVSTGCNAKMESHEVTFVDCIQPFPRFTWYV